ncbi:MAG: response regulator [Myxococcota bacterium]
MARRGVRRRVLVAQPSPTLQMLIRMTLGAADLAVECVSDGRSALTAARDDPPALVVVDSGLPGLDGFALAEALRGDPGTASTPILLIQPDWERPDMERMLHVGIQDVLTRPFEQHDLLERVRGLLGRPREATVEVDAATEIERDRTDTPLWRPARTVDGPPEASRATGRPRLPTAPGGDRPIEDLVARAVEERLPALVERAVAERVDALVERRLEAAVDAAVERALPDALAAAQKGLGQGDGGAVEAAATEELRRELSERTRELLGPIAEPVVWKVVPELAEDLIREEIRRLTEEGDA